MIVFVLGGARSGKSRFAERLALSLSPNPVYLATSRMYDEDHRARILRHRADRGPEWTTIEEDRELGRHAPEGRIIVIDCVTLWLANLFADGQHDVDGTLMLATGEFDRTTAVRSTFILVSNEVGQGVHAATEAGRKFTDLQGFMNQHIAARADVVALMVAGIPLVVKGALPTATDGARS